MHPSKRKHQQIYNSIFELSWQHGFPSLFGTLLFLSSCVPSCTKKGNKNLGWLTFSIHTLAVPCPIYLCGSLCVHLISIFFTRHPQACRSTPSFPLKTQILSGVLSPTSKSLVQCLCVAQKHTISGLQSTCVLLESRLRAPQGVRRSICVFVCLSSWSTWGKKKNICVCTQNGWRIAPH